MTKPEPMSDGDLTAALFAYARAAAEAQGLSFDDMTADAAMLAELVPMLRHVVAARDAAWQARCDALVAQAVAQERVRIKEDYAQNQKP